MLVRDFGPRMICAKCGMQEVEYEKRGEPQCTGKKPEAAESARKHIEYTWPDE